MQVQARRVFRLSSTMALSLCGAYALQFPLPFLAPLFALMLTAAPQPPMGLKGLLNLILVVLITLGVGLLLIPLLIEYPLSAVLIVVLGLYFSFYLTVNKGKGLVGALLTLGFTLISAAGTVSFALAITVIHALVAGIAVSIICHWLVYPWFPEEPVPAKQVEPPKSTAVQSNWIALRGTLIVLPAYLLTLTNPLMYLPIIMKSVALGLQSSTVTARDAGRELLGSTFLGGCFAIAFWVLLDIATNLWMFSLWMLLFGVYFSSKLYQLIASRFATSYWQNVVVTMLILLGPAVEDSNSGKDVYAAFLVRISLFVGVTLYAMLAIHLLEYLRTGRISRLSPSPRGEELHKC